MSICLKQCKKNNMLQAQNCGPSNRVRHLWCQSSHTECNWLFCDCPILPWLHTLNQRTFLDFHVNTLLTQNRQINVGPQISFHECNSQAAISLGIYIHVMDVKYILKCMRFRLVVSRRCARWQQYVQHCTKMERKDLGGAKHHVSLVFWSLRWTFFFFFFNFFFLLRVMFTAWNTI